MSQRNSIEPYKCLETNRMNPTTKLIQPARNLYLDLIERCLINTIYGDAYTDWRERGVEKTFDQAIRKLQDVDIVVTSSISETPQLDAEGRACGWQAGDASEPSAILFVKGCSGSNPVLPDCSSMGERM